MRIALINEISQADKNGIIEAALKKVVEPRGHEVMNYGMFGSEDSHKMTYIETGILTAVVLNGGAADYVVTGCGTGEGAMLSCNSFPGVICGHIEDTLDAYTFAQINDGNAVALPFAKGFGWGGELNLEYIFEKLFLEEGGKGYPVHRAESQMQSRRILNQIKEASYRDFLEILSNLDEKIVKSALSGEAFKEIFFEQCKDEKISQFVRKILKSSVD